MKAQKFLLCLVATETDYQGNKQAVFYEGPIDIGVMQKCSAVLVSRGLLMHK